MKKHRPAGNADIRHVLATLAGVMGFAAVFVYTGDSDLLIAISSGLAVSAVSYLAANLVTALRDSAS